MKYQVLAAACLVSIDVANAVLLKGKPIQKGDNFEDPSNFKKDLYPFNRALYKNAADLDGLRSKWYKSLNDDNWESSLINPGLHAKDWDAVVKPFDASAAIVGTVVPAGDLANSLEAFGRKSNAFDSATTETGDKCKDPATGKPYPDNVQTFVNHPECHDAVKGYIAAEIDMGHAAKDVQANFLKATDNKVFTDALAADKKQNGPLVAKAKKASEKAAKSYGAFGDLVLSEKNLEYSEYDGKKIIETSLTNGLDGLKSALQDYTYLNDQSSWGQVSAKLRSIGSAAKALAAASDADLAGPAHNIAEKANLAAGLSFTSTDDNSMANTNFKSYLSSMKSSLKKLNGALTNSASKTLIGVGYDFDSNTLDTGAQANARGKANDLSSAVGRVIRNRDFNNCTWSQLLGTVGGNVKCVGTGRIGAA